MRGDDALADRKTQPGATFFRREERLEDAGPHVRRDSAPLVRDVDGAIRARACIADDDAGTGGARLNGVQDDVDEDLLDLLGIGPRQQAGRVGGLDGVK